MSIKELLGFYTDVSFSFLSAVNSRSDRTYARGIEYEELAESVDSRCVDSMFRSKYNLYVKTRYQQSRRGLTFSRASSSDSLRDRFFSANAEEGTR